MGRFCVASGSGGGRVRGLRGGGFRGVLRLCRWGVAVTVPEVGGAGLGVLPGVEPGGPVALAVEGSGRVGGDFGCPGEDLGEQVQQVCPFAAGERGSAGRGHGAG
jgi:hypothetical protein